ncbi:MAG: hypothetical protein ACI4M4_07260 [Candidatus Ornithospirochaeta sp.]
MKKTAFAIAMIAMVFMMGCQNNAPEPDVSVPPETSGGGSESKAYSIEFTSSSRGISYTYRSMTVILRDNSKADVVLVFSDEENEYLKKFTDAEVVNTEGNLTIDLKDSGGTEAGTVILAIDESSSVLSATLTVGGSSFVGNATVLEDIKAPVSSESYSGTLFFGPSDNGYTAMTIEFKALESNSIVITLYTNHNPSDKGYSLYSSDLKMQEVLQYSNFLIGNDMNTLGETYRFAPEEDGSVVFYNITNAHFTYHMTRIM